MIKMNRVLKYVSALGLVASLSGCLTGGTLRSARTLSPGVGEWGLGWTATRYDAGDITMKTTDSKGVSQTVVQPNTSGAFVVPNVLPEVNYHLGVADNVEIGGRASLGALTFEADVKYRFLHTGGLHLAIDPTIGYAPFIFVQIVQATLPVLVTYEFSKSFSVLASAKGGYWSLSQLGSGSSSNSLSGTLSGSGPSFGGAIGVEFRGKTFALRPFVDFTHIVESYKSTFSDTQNGYTSTADVSQGLTLTTFGIAVSWFSGLEMEKLEKMDDKLDRIEQKIDEQNKNSDVKRAESDKQPKQ